MSHLRIYFSEKEPGNLTFATLGTFRNSRENRLNYENSTKLCDDTVSCGNLKVKSQKSWKFLTSLSRTLLKIPHPFQLTSGICNSYCICCMCLKIRVRSSSNEWKSRWVNPSNILYNKSNPTVSLCNQSKSLKVLWRKQNMINQMNTLLCCFQIHKP